MRIVILKIISSIFYLTISYSQKESTLQSLSNKQFNSEMKDQQQVQVDPELSDAILEYQKLIKKWGCEHPHNYFLN